MTVRRVRVPSGAVPKTHAETWPRYVGMCRGCGVGSLCSRSSTGWLGGQHVSCAAATQVQYRPVRLNMTHGYLPDDRVAYTLGPAK